MESSTLNRADAVTGLDRFCRQLLLRALSSADQGVLVIRDADGEFRVGDRSAIAQQVARINIIDSSCYRHLVLGGSIGAAEAYMTGDWTTPDLTAVIRFMSRNLSALEKMESGLAKLTRPLQRLYHWGNRNTEKGARRNIAAHYDLGNDLFECFLDPSMMYSSAIFDSADTTLEQASLAKLDRICRKLQLQPGDHVVEIGTGWGGFAIHAAGRYGCRVTTTTLSRRQYEYARARIQTLGLENRITLLLEDYRDLQGRYDKLVSIEMVEAVGHRYYPVYFETLGRLLKDNGLGLIQAITIDDKRYHQAIRNVDFIQRYIFPGSCIPSVTALLQACGRSSDLQLIHMDDITPHYARTLRDWRHNFFHNIKRIRELGYSEEFVRMWEFYFCYCEGGFEERVIGDVQLLFAKPGYRGETLPRTN